MFEKCFEISIIYLCIYSKQIQQRGKNGFAEEKQLNHGMIHRLAANVEWNRVISAGNGISLVAGVVLLCL